MIVMKNIIAIIILFFNISFAQIPTIEWQKTISNSGTVFSSSVRQTDDGGYIVVGYKYLQDAVGSDAWVTKVSADGTSEWNKTFGGLDDDALLGIEKTNDGGFILAGYTASTNGDITINNGGYDGWLIKLNSKGEIQWSKTYGGILDDKFQSIKITNDGGYVLTGYTKNDNVADGYQGDKDIWVLKLDESGTIEWSKAFGEKYEDIGNSIIQTKDGGYAVAARVSTIFNPAGGTADFLFLKLNASGVSEKKIIKSYKLDDIIHDIKEMSDGSFIAVGETSYAGGIANFHGGVKDAWALKINSNNDDVEWDKAYGGSKLDYCNNVIVTDDGGFIMVGGSTSNDQDVPSDNSSILGGWVVKTDSSGNIEWSKIYGEKIYSGFIEIQKTSDNGYILVGFVGLKLVKLAINSLSNSDFTNKSISDISYTPNPTTNQLSLTHTEPIKKATVYNYLGQLVLTQNGVENTMQLNVGDLAKGNYLVKIESATESQTVKFIKE